MLLNIVSGLSEENFFCGSRQANDFEWLKKQCYVDDHVHSPAGLDSDVHHQEARSPARPAWSGLLPEEGQGVSLRRHDAPDEKSEERVLQPLQGIQQEYRVLHQEEASQGKQVLLPTIA
jgi:hypothetical protein